MGDSEWDQVPDSLAIAIDKDDEGVKFGQVVHLFVDGLTVFFEFIPMITQQTDHHHHAIPLAMPPVTNRSTYLVKRSHLLDYHPYGLYHSSTVPNESSLLYIVPKSNIY